MANNAKKKSTLFLLAHRYLKKSVREIGSTATSCGILTRLMQSGKEEPESIFYSFERYLQKQACTGNPRK